MADMAETLHGRFTGIDLDELVDRRVVLTWLYWGMFWLIVTPSVGVALSGLFNYPDYLGTNNLGLTFGRLRPVHVNGVIFGAFSTSSSRSMPVNLPRNVSAMSAMARPLRRLRSLNHHC